MNNITPDNLPESWQDYPGQVQNTGEQLAKAKTELERLKLRADIIYAQLDKDIRQSPDKFGIIKPTEKGIEGAIVLQEGYQKAQEDIISAKESVNILESAYEAIKARGEALKSLTYLHGSMYNQSTVIPGRFT